MGGIRDASKFIENKTGATTGLLASVKGILGLAGQAAPLFGLAGSVLGALWPDEQGSGAAAVPPAPTVSTGSIKLTGTITTSTVLGQAIYIQVSGTPHNFDQFTNFNVRSSQPYYDCPLGLFNLRATPRAEQKIIARETRYPVWGNETLPTQLHTSYRITTDLQPVVNQQADLTAVSIKAAIVQKVRYSSLLAPRYLRC